MQSGRYRGRGRGGRKGGAGGQTTRIKGLFADGIWHCNCSPRLPAEHFKVKKEGKNQGRWFYTCQQNEPARCDFFLWDEDAKPREASAVLNNSRNEVPSAAAATKRSDAQEGWNAGRSTVPPVQGKGLFLNTRAHVRPEEDSPTPSPTLPSPISAAKDRKVGSKRSAVDAALDDEDDAFFPPLTRREEEELARVAAETTFGMETPQKAQKTGVYATPMTTGRKSPRRLPWLDPPAAPTTPMTTKKPETDYFATPSKAPQSPPRHSHLTLAVHESPETPYVPLIPETQSTLAAPGTPSPPARYKDALHDPADSASSLTSEVLAELSSIHIPLDKLSRIRTILSKHDLKTQGVVKGRDISRLALKAKDAKLAELEARLASLEAERECDRGVIRKLRWDKQVAPQLDGGDAGGEEESQL